MTEWDATYCETTWANLKMMMIIIIVMTMVMIMIMTYIMIYIMIYQPGIIIIIKWPGATRMTTSDWIVPETILTFVQLQDLQMII